ncbi:methyl-accepting chemotaxis protein [Chitinolyticbacter albus]|uniref:methyl-accepting chemotaxis protein n=1 Tax=Chitinolyticbacter albus TaxID=2961951 RepID=UPI00210915B5|nr:methyl-accepting chemotaxis protein [Chitinolyticbacter albus]
MTLSIRSRLIAFGLLATVLVFAAGLIGLLAIRHLSVGIADGGVSMSAVRNQGEADMMHDAIRADVLAMAHQMHAGADAQAFDAVEKEFTDHVTTLQQRVAANEALPLSTAERAALAALKPDLASYVNQARGLLQRYRAGQDDAQEYGAFAASFSRLEHSMGKFSELIEQRAQGGRETLDGASRRALSWAWVTMISGALLIAAMAWALTRSILRPLQRIRHFMLTLGGNLGNRCEVGTDEVGDIAQSVNQLLTDLAGLIGVVQSSAEQVAGTAERLAGQTEATQARISEVGRRTGALAADAADLANTTEEVAQRIAETARAASDAAALAHSSARAVSSVVEGNERLQAATLQSTDRIDALASSADRIEEVTRVIREIADQTNLLALNAAIEAARAGEQGRGFAVVADEVRKLAERTARSTTEIASITDEIQQCTEHTVTAMRTVSAEVHGSAARLDEAGAGQQRIVGSTDAMLDTANAISSVSRKQAAVIVGTADGIRDIAALVAQSQDEVGAIRNASSELDALARALRDNITRFRV